MRKAIIYLFRIGVALAIFGLLICMTLGAIDLVSYKTQMRMFAIPMTGLWIIVISSAFGLAKGINPMWDSS